jgi:Integrase core domain
MPTGARLHVVRKVWRQLQPEGFVYIGFIIDTFARRIVGWRASRTAPADFVLGALEWALHDRRPTHSDGLIHHSDRLIPYVSIKYTERLVEAGIEPSVGSVGALILDDAPHHLSVSPMTALWPRRSMAFTTPRCSTRAGGGTLRSGRICHARMSRLVQPPPTARTRRQHPAR